MKVIAPLVIEYKGETKPAHVPFEIADKDLASLQDKGATPIKPATEEIVGRKTVEAEGEKKGE